MPTPLDTYTNRRDPTPTLPILLASHDAWHDLD